MTNQKKGFEIEKKVRERLEEEFGLKFFKTRIKIGKYEREIDLISSDNRIAVQVKSGKDVGASGRINPYRLSEICMDYLILMSINYREKILVLTNKEMFEKFNEEIKGLPLSGVQIRF